MLQQDFAFSPEQGVAQPAFAPSVLVEQFDFASLLSVAQAALSDFSVATFSVVVLALGAFCAETLARVKANTSAITEKIIEILFMRLRLGLVLQM
ncbi:MAG: hypothetical protein IPH20_00155 [Bacteroidales bacterium]|nr:hypothetical protein [Bacteroidales bacterium]